MTYPGGKAGDGVYQRIISLIPPHSIYIEPFAGGAAIFCHKRLAPHGSILIDLDQAALAAIPGGNYIVHKCEDGITWLEKRIYTLPADAMVYCDPPYIRSSRKSVGAIYRYEMTDADHQRLLHILIMLPCQVLISGYASDLYDSILAHWHHTTFQAKTRQGMATEHLWANYPLPPPALHDYSYLGDDYRERERIKRKRLRWVKRLRKMDILERYCLLDALANTAGDGDEEESH